MTSSIVNVRLAYLDIPQSFQTMEISTFKHDIFTYKLIFALHFGAVPEVEKGRAEPKHPGLLFLTQSRSPLRSTKPRMQQQPHSVADGGKEY